MRRAVLFVLALPVLLLGTVFGKKVRFLTIPVALLGAGFLFLESLDRAPVADARLSSGDVERITAALLKRVKEGGPNHLHSLRLFRYAPPFAKAAGANPDLVQAAALLHDATKEDGTGEPKERSAPTARRARSTRSRC